MVKQLNLDRYISAKTRRFLHKTTVYKLPPEMFPGLWISQKFRCYRAALRPSWGSIYHSSRPPS